VAVAGAAGRFASRTVTGVGHCACATLGHARVSSD
jgi:hypothetical protein